MRNWEKFMVSIAMQNKKINNRYADCRDGIKRERKT